MTKPQMHFLGAGWIDRITAASLNNSLIPERDANRIWEAKLRLYEPSACIQVESPDGIPIATHQQNRLILRASQVLCAVSAAQQKPPESRF